MIAKEGLREVGSRGPRKCCALPPGLPAVRAHRDRLAFSQGGTTHKRPSSLEVQYCHWRAIRRWGPRPTKDDREPGVVRLDSSRARSLRSLTDASRKSAPQEEVTG